MSRALVCPNGHAMDEGYLECPCCGAYREPRTLCPKTMRACPWRTDCAALMACKRQTKAEHEERA